MQGICVLLLIEQEADVSHVQYFQAKGRPFLLLRAFADRVQDLCGQLLVVKTVPAQQRQDSPQLYSHNPLQIVQVLFLQKGSKLSLRTTGLIMKDAFINFQTE